MFISLPALFMDWSSHKWNEMEPEPQKTGILFLCFLEGLIDWTEARFKIVIDIAYDVISW